jgi:site-specific DNA-methyltransferase (adenine-specific)
MDTQNRTLFFGDNLEVLKEKAPENFFDLIYLDPPFNSNRNYNVLFKEGKIDASAQIQAFEDTWEWTLQTEKLFEDLKLNTNPQIALLINSLYEFIRPTPMMAYLVNMTARLIPLHEVLKTTGSLYLHCDPTASHYLKIILDVIFGKEHFRNEIVWCYATPSGSTKMFPRKHDIILFYTKSDDYFFEIPRIPHKSGLHNTGQVFQRDYGDRGNEIKEMETLGKKVEDWWVDIYPVDRVRSEMLGYPTQKPEALLERILKASSKEDYWVLDPFCGCGTTVAVAEKLHRNWVGIDISMQAVSVIKKRMEGHYPNIKINVDGIPMDFESAVSMAEKDKFAFQDWAITLVGANPPSGETKKGADRGIDGIILFYDYDREDLRNSKLKKIIVQVKGGNTNHRGDVATLKGDIDREGAPMGVLITLHEPTSEMKREAALAGEYKYSESTSFPKIQILSVKEWFEGNKLKLPNDTVNPFKRAEVKADQNELF